MKSRIVSFSAIRFGRTQESILEALKEKLEEARNLSPDLICFPEEVLICTGDKENPNWEKNNADALAMMRRYAKELHTNIVCSLEEPAEFYPGKSYNTSFVIDRSGEVIGRYRKKNITFRAIAGHGLPGSRVVTVDTDIGRIGMMICFDACWREGWAELEKQGAQLVIWESAYHGGNLLNGYAAVHSYPIVTSVWGAESRVIDAFGYTIAQSSKYDPCVAAELDLQSEIFHIDFHTGIPEKLRAAYGNRISINAESQGDRFMLSSNDPTLTLDEVKKTFGLRTYREYIDASTSDNEEMRARYPELD